MAKVMKFFNFFGVPSLNHCALFFWLWLLRSLNDNFGLFIFNDCWRKTGQQQCEIRTFSMITKKGKHFLIYLINVTVASYLSVYPVPRVINSEKENTFFINCGSARRKTIFKVSFLQSSMFMRDGRCVVTALDHIEEKKTNFHPAVLNKALKCRL